MKEMLSLCPTSKKVGSFDPDAGQQLVRNKVGLAPLSKFRFLGANLPSEHKQHPSLKLDGSRLPQLVTTACLWYPFVLLPSSPLAWEFRRWRRRLWQLHGPNLRQGNTHGKKSQGPETIFEAVGLSLLEFPQNLGEGCKDVNERKIRTAEARSPRDPTFGKGGGPWNRPRQGEFRFVHCAGTWPSQPGSVEAGPNH